MGNRIRAYDRQWRLIWDSDTATTFYRCPEGVKRWTPPDLKRFLNWPTNPLLTGGNE